MAIKSVGLSSGWVGKPEAYTCNKGSVGKKKIAFVGASYKFVHRVLRDAMLVGGFNDCHLVVHDIDPVPMKIVSDLLERMARQRKTNIKISSTLNLDEALKGADCVILSITTGGRESDFRSFEVCARYGVPVCIGDTLGPAALARNLREVPVVVELARKMEKLCPKALLLNFTNPMSVITGAASRYSSIRTYGLCHSADELFNYFAKIFHCKKNEVDMVVGGINHQSFVTQLTIKGRDRTRDILQASLKSKAKLEDQLVGRIEEVNLQQDIYRALGAWPSCGGDHLAEFYQYFFTPRRIGMFAHEQKRVLPGRKPFGRSECPKIIYDWAYGPQLVGDLHLLTGEHAHELMWSHFTGEAYSRTLNVLNSGEYIRGLPKDACVEIMTTVKGPNFTAKPINLPPAVLSLVHRWATIHDLSIKAAMHCDREAARQALFLDAHTQDLYDIAPMVEDFITYLKPWMPKGWYDKPTSVLVSKH